MSLRDEVIKLAHAHPEFRKDLLPILRKTSSRVRDLGEDRGKAYTSEQALENVIQYGKWSREIMKRLDAYLKEMEKAGLKPTKGGSIWTRVSEAYEIAKSLGELEDFIG